MVLGRVRQEHQRLLVESTWICCCFICFYGTDDGISGGDVRTCHLHFRLLKHYCDVQIHVEEDYNRVRTLPGGGPLPTTLRGWVEHRSRILNYPSTIRMAWALAGIHDALKSNNPALARARTALALAAVDQSALDSGSWALAQGMTLENPPRHPLPTRGAQTQPSSHRHDWWLRDKDNYLESRKRLMLNNRQRLGNADKEETDKKPPKVMCKPCTRWATHQDGY